MKTSQTLAVDCLTYLLIYLLQFDRDTRSEAMLNEHSWTDKSRYVYLRGVWYHLQCQTTTQTKPGTTGGEPE